MRRRGGFCTFSGTDTPEQVIASSKMRKTHGPFDNFCLSATRLLLLHASTPCSCLFSASSNLFFLLHCIFKNEENARTIRPFYSPCPPEASKTLNITKILCFTTQTGPQGPKTRAKSPLSTHRSRGAHWASAASQLGFFGASGKSAVGATQEAPKWPPRDPQAAPKSQNLRMVLAFSLLSLPLVLTVFYNDF